MNKQYSKLDKVGRKSPFKVPENYFEQLNSQILDRLDETEVEIPPTVSLWGKARPWAYMAAMFAGLALMFKLFGGGFIGTEEQYAKSEQKQIELLSAFLEEEDYDDVYDYFESQAIELYYRETAYINE